MVPRQEKQNFPPNPHLRLSGKICFSSVGMMRSMPSLQWFPSFPIHYSLPLFRKVKTTDFYILPNSLFIVSVKKGHDNSFLHTSQFIIHCLCQKQSRPLIYTTFPIHYSLPLLKTVKTIHSYILPHSLFTISAKRGHEHSSLQPSQFIIHCLC
jgi:hypothetical protein